MVGSGFSQCCRPRGKQGLARVLSTTKRKESLSCICRKGEEREGVSKERGVGKGGGEGKGRGKKGREGKRGGERKEGEGGERREEEKGRGGREKKEKN